MLLVVFSIIIVSEILFLKGQKLDAVFIAFWAPTILGFMNYFKNKGIMEFILIYSIIVGVIFMIWMFFVVRMYRKLDD